MSNYSPRILEKDPICNKDKKLQLIKELRMIIAQNPRTIHRTAAQNKHVVAMLKIIKKIRD